MPPVPKTWALTWYQNYRSWRQLRVYAGTDSTQHLFMAWQRYKPIKKLIFKVVRGVIVDCGWVWVWPNPHILEQWEHGDSFYHTFRIDTLHPGDHVWYYLFTPLGPYDLQCQGPLVHVPPPETLPWARSLIVGTQTKGIYRTNDFSGPGDPQPFGLPQNNGLTDLRVWQLCPYAADPRYAHFAITGPQSDRTLYRREPLASPDWIPILTDAQACTVTDSASGSMTWVATNINHPTYIYVLFNSGVTVNGTWCIRSADEGASWLPFQIYAGLSNYKAGNIVAGINQGESTLPPGDVLYASLNTGAGGHFCLYCSDDNGATWFLRDTIGTSIYAPRCSVDPTNQKTVYMGAYISGDSPWDLFRSIDHGLNLTEADGPYHLGTFVEGPIGQQWIHRTAPEVMKVLGRGHVYETWDAGLVWTDHGLTQFSAVRLSVQSRRPDYLYLARDSNAPLPPNPQAGHVIYASQDNGATMFGRSGAHCTQSDGGGDSIPFDCGGVCLDGLMQTDLD